MSTFVNNLPTLPRHGVTSAGKTYITFHVDDVKGTHAIWYQKENRRPAPVDYARKGFL